MGAKKRGRVRPTDDWELFPPLFGWPEHEKYEAIRPLTSETVRACEAFPNSFSVKVTAGCRTRGRVDRAKRLR